MNRRGQFFLIAALVIITIIIGLSSLQVSTKVSRENTRIFDLTNEIDLEGKSVVDHGVFVGKTPAQVQEHIAELMDYYVNANPGMNITVVYGDSESYTIVKGVEKSTGSITIGRDTTIPITKIVIVATSGSCGGAETCEVQVQTSDESEPVVLTIEERQNFYVVIVDAPEGTGERTVTSTGY